MIIKNNRVEKDSGLILVPVLHANGQVEKYIQLLPGNNFVDNAEWERAKIHCYEILSSKMIQEVQVTMEGKKSAIESISDLKPERAKEIITDCFNLKTLDLWFQEETRGDVRNAIDDRIRFINKDNDKTTLKRNRRG
jgi:hypothetical protein